MNYTLTRFELDNKEAIVSILFMYVVTLSVVFTLKDTIQRIKGMCEIMSKGSKEALTVLIVTHVERVERSLNSFNCYSCYSCRKGRKWCLQFLYF